MSTETTMTETEPRPAPADLVDMTWDGSVDLDNGDRVRVTIESDEHTSVDDFDCYGRLAWVEDYRGDADWHRYGTSWVYSGQHAPRPDGFDGNAEILDVGHGDRMWWQPPADGFPRGTDEFRRMRTALVDLLCHGFSVVSVELETANGASFSSALGGCDSVYPELLDDLWHEVEQQRVEELNRAAVARRDAWARSLVSL
jgi:hypothetical protein